MNVISLFGGTETGHLSFKKCDNYFSSEIDKFAKAIGKYNFPNIIDLGDVTLITEETLSKMPKIDWIIFGSPCFVKGSLVMTNRKLKPIEDIEIGDMVVTHNNRFKKVTNTFIKHDIPIWSIKPSCSNTILTTEEHPFYVRKMKKVWENNKNNRVFEEPIWKPLKELSKDYYVGVAINQKSKLPDYSIPVALTSNHLTPEDLSEKFNNPNFWWLVGRYLGDGWTTTYKRKDRKNTHHNRVFICCSKTNEEELLEIQDKIDGLFDYRVSEERTSYKFCISNISLYEYLQQFGKYAHGKELTNDIFDLPKHLLHSFLDGYISADGYTKANKVVVSSVSEKLIYGIGQCIAKAYNRPYSVRKGKVSPTKIIENRIVNQKDSYILSFKTTTDAQDKAFYENDYIWSPIKKLQIESYRDTVYNFEVEDDNSYTINNVIVHNCQSFSIAGKQEGFKGKSGLFYEAVRIVEYINYYNNPEVNILMENVVMKKQWQDTITRELKLAINREVYCTRINSNLVSAQNRPRLYWTNFEVNQPADKNIYIKDILEETVDKKYYLSKKGIVGNLKSSYKDRQPKNIFDKSGCLKVGGNKANIVMDYDYWESLNENSVIDSKLGARNLTPVEYERLQTLPDNYTKFGDFNGEIKEISDSQRYKCIGNGWTHEIINHIINERYNTRTA